MVKSYSHLCHFGHLILFGEVFFLVQKIVTFALYYPKVPYKTMQIWCKKNRSETTYTQRERGWGGKRETDRHTHTPQGILFSDKSVVGIATIMNIHGYEYCLYDGNESRFCRPKWYKQLCKSGGIPHVVSLIPQNTILLRNSISFLYSKVATSDYDFGSRITFSHVSFLKDISLLSFRISVVTSEWTDIVTDPLQRQKFL